MISKCLLASITAAVLLTQARTLTSAQETPVSTIVWCSPYSLQAAGSFAPAKTVETAEKLLCDGQFRQANDQFAAILPYFRQHQSVQACYWMDNARGYFYSLIAIGAELRARNFLTALEVEQTPKWQPAEGDRLFWDGSPQAAFRKYATEMGDLSQMAPDSAAVPAKNITDAAQAGGAWETVVAILSRPADSAGVSPISSLQLLMLGNAFAIERDWLHAFSAWVQAANSEPQIMECDGFQDWNLSALEMIYYYRAHIPQSQLL
jgi:hypothetical protein